MQIKDLLCIRCTDETLKDRIEAIRLSNYNKELKISQKLYLMYNECREFGNILTLSTSRSTMLCFATELIFKGEKFLIPFIQEISGATFTVEGEKLIIKPSSKVSNIPLDSLFQQVSSMKENENEIHNRFLETRKKKPCYYFICLGITRWRDYGCSVIDALDEPAKVEDAWTTWAMFRPNANFEETIFDADENDITHQIISESTVHVVQTLSKYAENNFGKVFFSSGITLE